MTRLLCPAFALLALLPQEALACGCFLPPDPISPLVQTGERILFRAENGTITAHIQIAFAGQDTSQFGWTVPVPSVPTLEVGDDAVFNALNEETGAEYNVDTSYDCQSVALRGPSPAGGCGCPFDGYSGPGGGGAARSSFRTAVSPDIVVIRSTVGPYDFAVLKATSKDDLITWLNLNRFFLPTASDELLKPYIGAGLYFLALKMRAGSDAGEIKPIILTYSSDLPMIPLSLTAATTAPRLPVLVWILGRARAIPRNLHHVVLNDALLDWRGQVKNYDEVVAAAIAEAPGGQAFITEYSGPSAGARAKVPAKYQRLFEGAPVLTRLYTVLAASSLNKDPVFSANPDLPPVPRGHDASFLDDCAEGGVLTTALGFKVRHLLGNAVLPAELPAAERIEVLREEGLPEPAVDNHDLIVKRLGGQAPLLPPADGAAGSGDDGGAPKDDDAGIGLRQLPGETLLASLVPLFLVLRAMRRRRL